MLVKAPGSCSAPAGLQKQKHKRTLKNKRVLSTLALLLLWDHKQIKSGESRTCAPLQFHAVAQVPMGPQRLLILSQSPASCLSPRSPGVVSVHDWPFLMIM